MNKKQIIKYLKEQIARISSIIDSCNLEAAVKVYEIELHCYEDMLRRIQMPCEYDICEVK